jgi:hypothetical protein
MRDLGRAMIWAARQLTREMKLKIPILSCHSHFLRDVGQDLMAASYDQIRCLVRRHCIRGRLRALARNLGRGLSGQLPDLREDVESWAKAADYNDRVLPTGASGLAIVRALAQWALDYKRDGHSLGFPFDRPYLDFYRRCCMLHRATDAFLRQAPGDKRVRRALMSLARTLNPVIGDKAFSDAATKLVRCAALFERLRQVLRLSPDKRPTPGTVLTPKQATVALQGVHGNIRRLQQDLRRNRPMRGPAQDARQAVDIVLDHLKRHGRSLWGHAIRLPGGDIRLVDRTNNALEGFFRGLKHGERRRSGRKVLTYDLERLPAAAALATNLTRPDYVEILCGSLDRLSQAFMEIDTDQRALLHPVSIAGQRAAANEILSSSMPHADLALIRTTALRDCILEAAQSRAPYVSLGS